jgi:hypothetical protein
MTARSGWEENLLIIRKKLGSDLGPITAENQLKLRCETQNQAKRINEIALHCQIRDQGVGGSNPLSPTNTSCGVFRLAKDFAGEFTPQPGSVRMLLLT